MIFDNLNISGECVCTQGGKLLISAVIRVITPEIAAEMLKHNPHNRHISKDAVQKYASDIREGRWELTGDSITFDTNGILKNGQHRLTAICQGIKIDVYRQGAEHGHTKRENCYPIFKTDGRR